MRTHWDLLLTSHPILPKDPIPPRITFNPVSRTFNTLFSHLILFVLLPFPTILPIFQPICWSLSRDSGVH